MDRRSRTRLPTRRAQTSTAVAAAREARPPPFSTCPCECSPWLQRGRLRPQTRLGARHEPPQRGERQEADADSDQLRLANEDRSDLHAAGNEWIGDGAKVGRPEELGGGTQRDTKPEGAADLREHR